MTLKQTDEVYFTECIAVIGLEITDLRVSPISLLGVWVAAVGLWRARW